MTRIICIFCTMLIFSGLRGQELSSNEGALIDFSFHYGFFIPAGDLSDRFGNNFYAGFGSEYISQSDLIFGFEGGIRFGNQVKEDALAALRNDQGEVMGIVDGVGVLGNVSLRQRGYYVGGKIGKLFPVSSVNKRSSIRATIGLGIFQHRIRIQDDDGSIPALEGDLTNGYDRLSNGLSLQEFIGYQIMSQDRRMNFYFGLEFYQAFTQGRRSFDINLMAPDDEKRTDLSFGLKVGWIVPIYLQKSEQEIYY